MPKGLQREYSSYSGMERACEKIGGWIEYSKVREVKSGLE